jgi:hypothetical protein
MNQYLRLGCWLIVVLTCALAPLGGCQIFGVIGHAIPKYEKAAYPGLAGQSVGVMVWVDRGARIDWSSLQRDVANTVQELLKRTDAKELKGASYPVLPDSIVRYQVDHPGVEAMAITDVAPKLGVSRLVYIEIDRFSTRSDLSLQMFRGNVTASLRVVEITNGQATVAYEETGIRAFFPPKSPEEGTPNANDQVIYRGTVVALAQQIVNRVTTHEVE